MHHPNLARAAAAILSRTSLGGLVLLVAWAAFLLTAAASHAQTPASSDVDADGLPDAWEAQYGLDPGSANGPEGPDGDPDRDGQTNAAEFTSGTHPRSFFRRYFAEGAKGPYWSTRLALANPSASVAARAVVIVLNDDGTTVSAPLAVQPLSRTTVAFRDLAGVADAFSVVLESDALLAADRTMAWDGDHFGAHTETGLPGPATSWYFAEGATHSGFALYYLVQNPNESPVEVTARYLLPGGPPEVRSYVVGARSRRTIWINGEGARLASTDVAASFSSTLPIAVERSMYLMGGSRFTAGHAAAGATSTSVRWFFGEGCTGPLFDTFVLVGNPGPDPAGIRATYRTDTGVVVERFHTVEPWARLTIWVDAEAPELADVSTSIEVVSTTGVPVVAERTMWWPGPSGAASWHEAHASLGATSTGPRWAFAEGEVTASPSRDTYLLIANTTGRDGTARVVLLPEDGRDPVARSWPVYRNSRLTVSVTRDFPEFGEGRFGVLVESVGEDPVPFVAERSMYGSPGGRAWTQGTNAHGLDYSLPLRELGPITLPAGSPAVELALGQTDLLPQGVTFDVTQSEPLLALMTIDASTAALRIAPAAGAAGSTWVTVRATAAGGLITTRTFLVTFGQPRARERVIEVTGPLSYVVDADPGAPPVNRFLRLENVGGTAVEGITLSRAGYDWSTLDGMLAGIVTPGMSADETARAIWQFARTSRMKAQPPTVNPDIHDPVVLFNGFGYGYCDDVATAVGLLLERAGLPARLTNLPGHVVAEAYYDGDWHLFDADIDGLFLERDNRTVASLAEVTADPWLIERAGWRYTFVLPLYAEPGPRVSYAPGLAGRTGHDLALTLRPREWAEFRWVGFGPRFSDESIEATAPVVHANGIISSTLDAESAASLQWLFDRRGVVVADDVAGLAAAFVPYTAGVDAEVTYRVAAPWPLVAADLDLDGIVGSSGRLDVAVSSSGTQVNLNWWELVNERYRLDDAFVEETNVRNYLEAGDGAALHPRTAGTPASLVYRFPLRAQPGARVRVGGWFYRYSDLDEVALHVSRDGVAWAEAWRMSDTGGLRYMADVTDRVSGLDAFFVKVEFQASAESWMAGLDELLVEGIAPFAFQSVWSTTSAEAEGVFEVAMPAVLSPSPSREPVFEYFVRVRMRGDHPGSVGLGRLAVRSTFQVSPRSLPSLQPGSTAFDYRDSTSADHRVRVTHGWFEDATRRAPLAPSRERQPQTTPTVDASAAFHLEWDPYVDPDGDPVLAYHIQICDRQDCVYPLGGMVDVVETWSDPGADGAFGTADDGPATPMWSAHTVFEHTFFTPGRSYYWRVRALDATGLWGPFGPAWSFTVGGT